MTEPRVYVATVRDEALLPLLDYRRQCVLKAQPEGVSIHVLRSITRDAQVGGVLRRLVTDYRRMVTPHFATVLDAYAGTVRAPGVPDLVGYVCVQERAHVPLLSYIDAGQDDAHVRALVWEVLYTVYAANVVLGLKHRDLHPGNVMVRAVKGTPYEGRVWAYRLRDDPTAYYLIPPEQHGNLLVEIIDFGLSTVAQEPSGVLDRVAFWTDAYRFLSQLAVHISTDGPPQALERDVMSLANEQPDAWWEHTLFAGHVERHAMGDRFEGLPLLVAYMQATDTPARLNKRTAATAKTDKVVKRAKVLQCSACDDPALWREETPEGRLFCSYPCQLIAHGLVEVHE
jgi:hypothetical protein